MSSDKHFAKQNLFGKMAENVVYNILRRRHDVFHLGHELTIERFSKIDKPSVYTKAHSMICAMPDFVIYTKENDKKVYFLEVKATRLRDFKNSIGHIDPDGMRREHYKLRDMFLYYPDLVVVNLVWDSDKPQIKLYQGKPSKYKYKVNDITKEIDSAEVEEIPTSLLLNEQEIEEIKEIIKDYKVPKS